MFLLEPVLNLIHKYSMTLIIAGIVLLVLMVILFIFKQIVPGIIVGIIGVLLIALTFIGGGSGLGPGGGDGSSNNPDTDNTKEVDKEDKSTNSNEEEGKIITVTIQGNTIIYNDGEEKVLDSVEALIKGISESYSDNTEVKLVDDYADLDTWDMVEDALEQNDIKYSIFSE